MEIKEFNFKGLLLLTPKIFKDERGFFCERHKENDLLSLGIKDHFIQDNFSRSGENILRGLHFQSSPAQSKLITCTSGLIQDVVVDLRQDEPTFGQHHSLRLSGSEPQWFYVPAGFAHGFLVLSPGGADVLYKVNAPYNPRSEGALKWNDPYFNIQWENQNPKLSPKDLSAQTWNEFLPTNPFTSSADKDFEK